MKNIIQISKNNLSIFFIIIPIAFGAIFTFSNIFQKNLFHDLVKMTETIEIKKNSYNSIENIKKIDASKKIEEITNFFDQKKYARKTKGELMGDLILDFHKDSIFMFSIIIDKEIGIFDEVSYRTQVVNDKINIQTYLNETDYLTLLNLLSITDNEDT
jgi:cell division protein FtsB